MIIQVVRAPPWAKMEHYIRRQRDYSDRKPGEIKENIRFAEAAYGAYGKKMTGELPPAAEAVQETAGQPPELVELPDIDVIPISATKILVRQKKIEKERERPA